MGQGMKYRLGDLTVNHWNDWDRVPRDPFIIFGGNILAAPTVGQIIFASVVSTIAVTAVTSWALNALAPKPDFSAMAGSRGLLTNTRDAAAPQQVVYGQIRKGGVVTYLESTGDTNQYLHQIICVAGHEINSFENFYINDEIITRDANDFVTTSKWVGSDSNSKILIKEFTGAPNQNVYTTLNALSNGPEWQNKQTGDDTNFRGQGIACVYVRMEYDQDVFAEGIPLFTFDIKGKKIYNYYNGQTEYSNNAANVIADYITSKYGLDDSGKIDSTSFTAAANTSRELVDKYYAVSNPPQEERYHIDAVFDLSRTPSSILSDMMTACAGTLFWGQGAWRLVVGEYTSPVKTLTLDDFRSGITLETKHSRRDTFNTVRGTFIDAEQDYITTNYPEKKEATFITEDNGLEQALELDLPCTTSKWAAQRLAKMTLFRAREQMTINADFGMAAFEVQVGEIVSITNERYGWSAKDFEVVGWKLTNDGDAGDLRINLTLRETSSTAFAWDGDAEDIISNDSNVTNPSSNITPSNVTVTDAGEVQSDGTFVAQLDVGWTAGTNSFVLNYEVQWRLTGTSSYNTTITTGNSIVIGPVQSGEQYQIRVRAYTTTGRFSPYVSASVHTVGGDTIAPSPISNLQKYGGPKSVTLDWDAPTTQVGGGTLYDLRGYYIYRNTTNSKPTSAFAFVSADKFVDGGLAENTTYYYWVEAIDQSTPANVSTAVASGAVTTDAAVSVPSQVDTKVYSGVLYYTTIQATAPSAPTASNFTFDVSTKTFTTLETNWSHSQTTVDYTSLAKKEWTVTYTVTVNTNNTVDSIVFGTVNGAFQITDTIESDVFTSGSTGWRISKDGTAEFDAAVIRGELSADHIKIDNVTLDTNASNQLVIKAVDTDEIVVDAVTKSAYARVSTDYHYDHATYGGATLNTNLALNVTVARTGRPALVRFIFITSVYTSWTGGLTGGGTGGQSDTAMVTYQFAIKKTVNGGVSYHIPSSFIFRGMSNYVNVVEFRDTVNGTATYQPYIASFNVYNNASVLNVLDQSVTVLEVKR